MLALVVKKAVFVAQNYSQAEVIDDEVKNAIADLIPLAPSHNPANLEGINTQEDWAIAEDAICGAVC
jgi:acetate kinase